ncbi:Xaa-Pro aminopeptidase [Sphaerisporangium rubeum]|uniref:Xaa-Pro aminopeptidase n=2 Tax=Sphaerisporangium rubeum TaxID=321317 RepID=A0A7X0ICK0_9ACTN|nr:M24 family metallopeptidase [Sphaerisporangium rubeum]MBB6472740.1 Xaa-Pro aminopeptidase [Sphaerisporangium rubeum]
MTAEVMAAVLARMAEAGLDAMVLRPSIDQRYVTGWQPEGFLVLVPGREPVLAAGPEEAAELLPAGAARVAVDGEMRARELFALRVQADLVLASAVLGPLRARKRPSEVAAVGRAAEAADRVLAVARELPWYGATEEGMARRLTGESGAPGVVAVTVAAGENTARSCHTSTSRVINPGDAVQIHVTARYGGYHAVASRGFVVAEPPEDFDALHAVLLTARDAALAAVRPGATAADVHTAAWTVLDDSGYGPYTATGTGHGIGLDPRETPRLAPGDGTPLEPGMTLVVAPGVHVPDLYGARVGDVVECTLSGVRPMNLAAPALHVLDP